MRAGSRLAITLVDRGSASAVWHSRGPAPPSGWDTREASSSERRGPAHRGRCAPWHPDVHLGTQMCTLAPRRTGRAAAAGCRGTSALAWPGRWARLLRAPRPTALPRAEAGVSRQESAGEVIWVPEMNSRERLSVQSVPRVKEDWESSSLEGINALAGSAKKPLNPTAKAVAGGEPRGEG